MIYLKNKYTKYYYAIINSAKKRIPLGDDVLEVHHIIPECFFINRTRPGVSGWLTGDPNDENNLIKLTAKEHFICHRLLTKMTTGIARGKMLRAIWLMSNKCKINSRTYDVIKKDLIASMAKTWDDRYGIAASNEIKNKISGENHRCFGKTWEEIHGKEKAAQMKTTLKLFLSDKKNNPFSNMKRENNINYNSTIIHWIHESGIERNCVYLDLRNEFNLHQGDLSLVTSGKRKSSSGWFIYTPDIDKKINTKYNWYHADGMIEYCTCKQLSIKYDLMGFDFTSLLKSVYGWRVEL